MARAGTNTWVSDVYDGAGTEGGLGGFVYTRDSDLAERNSESECAACHQPEVWIAEPFSALEPVDSEKPAVHHGISCDVCHKIAAVDKTRVNYPGFYPGASTFTRPKGPEFRQVQYGMLGDVDYSNRLMRASYQPDLGSAVCGTCHQDKNDPDEDGDFEEENGVISEPTYLEWLESPYGDPESPRYETCVGCHMPPSGVDRVSNRLDLPRDPSSIRSHAIEGTTALFLENAVTLELDAEVHGETLDVSVSVSNDRTGHHVPTGVTIRNVILLVEAWREIDGQSLVHTGDQTVHELGGVGDPDEGYYSGLPGKLFAKVNHDTSGRGPVFFTEASGIQFDSRILALATDVTSYSFALPGEESAVERSYRVRARLIYRRS